MIVQTVTYLAWTAVFVLHFSAQPEPLAPQPGASVSCDLAAFKRSTCT